MITQNGESSRDLLLSMINRTALAPGWGAGGECGGVAQPPRALFKTFIMLLPVTFSQLDPQLGLVGGKTFYLFTDVLNCLTVKYLAG